MYVISSVCVINRSLSTSLSGVVESLMLDIIHKVFILTMLIGTIDFYDFIQLSVTLTLAGVSRSAENKTSGLHFLSHFSTDQDEIWHGHSSRQSLFFPYE